MDSRTISCNFGSLVLVADDMAKAAESTDEIVAKLDEVKDGQVESFEQQRTKKRALARLVEVVAQAYPCGESAHLCALQVAGEVESLVAELKS